MAQAEAGSHQLPARPAVFLGPGRRLAGLDRVFEALAAPPGSLRSEVLADLEDLILGDPGPGILMLDCDTVPDEDIGFVRRFLKRDPRRNLVLVGHDARSRTARRILSLPRASWLAWPPDLEQLRALTRAAQSAASRELGSAELGSSAPADAELLVPTPQRALRTQPSQRRVQGLGASREQGQALQGDSSPRPGEVFDLGTAIEELLTGAALRGPDAPGYGYSTDGDLRVRAPRVPLVNAFDAVLALANACSLGEDSVRVRAAIEPDSDNLAVGFDFPAGPLGRTGTEGTLDTRLVRQHLSDDLAGLLTAAQSVFESLGAQTYADFHSGSRARVDVWLPSDLRLALREEA